jgi:hypothetical protein
MVILLLLSYYCIIFNLENPKPQSPLRNNPHWDPPVQPKISLGNTKALTQRNPLKWELKPQAHGLLTLRIFSCDIEWASAKYRRKREIFSCNIQWGARQVSQEKKNVKELLRVFWFFKMLTLHAQ